MFGNILMILILIFYGCLANLLLKPMPGGDYGVGYSFMWLFYVLGFSFTTGLLVWNMNLNHCFDWVSTPFYRYRNWLQIFGWLAFVIAVVWSLDNHSKGAESETPRIILWLIWSKVYIWLPILMIISSYYLLNAERETGFAPYWIKFTIQLGFSVSTLITLSVLWISAQSWVKQKTIENDLIKVWQAEKQTSSKEALEYINTFNESSINGLLKFTHPKNVAEQRNSAIEKIKSFENWELDLIGILEQKNLSDLYVYEDDTYLVYEFLNANKIIHPEKFIQPILSSLNVLTTRVKNSINDPYNLDLGITDLEIVCRVLEYHFKDWAAQFRPSMVKLYEVLEIQVPERKNKEHKHSYNTALERYRLAVKNWLESNP